MLLLTLTENVITDLFLLLTILHIPVTQTYSHHIITTVSAVDGDISLNETINYSLLRGKVS